MSRFVGIILFAILIAFAWYMSEQGFYRGSNYNESYQGVFVVLWGIAFVVAVVSSIVSSLARRKQIIERERKLIACFAAEKVAWDCVIHSSGYFNALALTSKEGLIAYIRIDNSENYELYVIDTKDIIKSEITVNSRVVSSVGCNGFAYTSSEKPHVEGIITKHIAKRKLLKGTVLNLYTQSKDFNRIRIHLIPLVTHYTQTQNSLSSIIDKANEWQSWMLKLSDNRLSENDLLR